MSYSADIRTQLLARIPRKTCCKQSFINGLLFAAGETVGETIRLHVPGRGCAESIRDLLEKTYSQTPASQTSRGRGAPTVLTFRSPSSSHFLSHIDQESLPDPATFRCSECPAHFLAGIFLACGTISDPGTAYRLDLVPQTRSGLIAAYLTSIGLPPLMGNRRGKIILYYRSGERIAEFFAHMRWTEPYFHIQNVSLTHEIANLTNRQNNCTVGNIARAMDTVSEQIRILREMKEKNGFSVLSDELRETAELRLQYDTYTLNQLAAVSNPPLTKSGLYHRLRKIMDIAGDQALY